MKRIISQKKNNISEIDFFDDLILSDRLVFNIEKLIKKNDKNNILIITNRLHSADIAELIEKIRPELRIKLCNILKDSLKPEVLSKLDDTTLDLVIKIIGSDQTAEALEDLDTDEVIEVLDDLDSNTQHELLSKMDKNERILIQESLNFPEYSAGRLMQRDHLSIPTSWSVGNVIDFLRDETNLPSEFYELIIINSVYRPIGIVTLNLLPGSAAAWYPAMSIASTAEAKDPSRDPEEKSLILNLPDASLPVTSAKSQ